MGNVFEEGFDSVINFANSWASMFGVDWIDRIAGRKRGDWTEATLNKVISEIYKKIDQKDVGLINKLQQQLEGLIGVITSPTTKNIIKKWRQRIQEKYNKAITTQATHEFEKNSMQRLASDIENLSPYEFTKSKGEKLKEEFRQKVRDTVGNDAETQERVKQAEGWGKFKFNKDNDSAQSSTKQAQTETKVEERL